MKPKIFIHTNDKQYLGAKLCEFAFKIRSKHPELFDVEILRLEETKNLFNKEGCQYIRKGSSATWHNKDLQSFSPLRMAIPQLMNFKGKALVTDPDVFAVTDVWDLLNRDMEGKSIICRNVSDGYRGNGHSFYATSVMLLDCEKLTHWKFDQQVEDLFNKKFDYGDWIALKKENPQTIGSLEEEWNQFDTLTPKTKLLHTTERSTQPWRTGLPVDYDTTTKKNSKNTSKLRRVLIRLGFKKKDKYLPHPDPHQEVFILKLIQEALDSNFIDKKFLENEIKKSNLRKDIFSKLASLK